VPQQPLQATRLLTRITATPVHRSLSSSAPRQASQETAHEDHYDPPGGWLWGIPPGQQYKKEGWENITYYGFVGGFIVAGIAYAFKPDTSIQTWALEEARRRLETEGILTDADNEKK